MFCIVSASDLAILSGFLMISSVLFLATGLVQLPGSEVPDFFDRITDSPSVEPDDRYILETTVDVNTGESSGGGIIDENSFEYQTELDEGFNLNIASSQSLSVLGSNDARVEYIVRSSDGRVVATDSKYLGDLGNDFETVSFETSGHPSGEYTVEYVYSDEWNSLIGSSSRDDVFQTSVQVPKVGGS